jgi:hypothetical protein
MHTPRPTDCYKNHQFPLEIISHVAWLRFRFCLGYRDDEYRSSRGLGVTVSKPAATDPPIYCRRRACSAAYVDATLDLVLSADREGSSGLSCSRSPAPSMPRNPQVSRMARAPYPAVSRSFDGQTDPAPSLPVAGCQPQGQGHGQQLDRCSACCATPRRARVRSGGNVDFKIYGRILAG